MGNLWNRSGIVERFADDLPAAGAKARFYQGGTLVPLTVYQDGGEIAAHPFPVLADSRGRWPPIFVPYIASYDVQVSSADEVQITFTQGILNPNPVNVTAPITGEAVTTGMIHFELLNGTKTGYVRLNGRTIGDASSGATEMAHATATLPLYQYLYNNLPDSIAPVIGGRLAGNATGDFNAHRPITLPSFRGAGPVGLDDMGNTAAGNFSGLTFTVGNATQAGSLLGVNGVTLTVQQMPVHSHGGGSTSADGNHTHAVSGNISGNTGNESVKHTHDYSGTTGNESVTHTHPVTIGQTSTLFTAVGAAGRNAYDASTTSVNTGTESQPHQHGFGGTSLADSVDHTHPVNLSLSSGATDSQGSHTHTFTTGSAGGLAGVTQPFNNLGVSRLGTWFIKL